MDRVGICLVVVWMLAAGVGCDAKGDGASVVTFKGGNLTIEDLKAHGNAMARDRRFRDNPEMLTPEAVFDHAVNMEMVIAEGLRRNLHLDPVVRERLHSQMADLFLQLLEEELVPELSRDDIGDGDVLAFYNDNPELYTRKPLYSVSMVKCGSEAEALSVSHRIASGELTFAEAARAYSVDAKSAGQKGHIGTRSLERFRPEWRGAIAALEAGKASPPVRIRDHWYLFLLTGKTGPERYTFEEQKERIRNDVLYARYRDAWENAYEELKREFGVSIDPAQFQKFLGDS